MQEGHAIDRGDDVAPAQPLSVLAARREGVRALDEAGGRLVEDLLPRGRLVEGLSGGLRLLAGAVRGRVDELHAPRLARRRPGRRGIRLLPLFVLRGLHGAQIPEDVHHVVVAEEHDDPPARRARLLLEAHQEVEHRARLDAAIEDIAHLYEDTSATGPVGGTVQEPGHGQDAHQLVVGSVDVADRDDTGSARDPASALRGERAPDEGERGDCHEAESAARGQAIEEADLHFLQPSNLEGHADGEDERGLVLVRIEEICGELHMLHGDAGEHAALDRHGRICRPASAA